ncbi:MAG: MFS transporter [Planctomycetota bacterium]|jgi:MFS family permease|nr:MFS transporter [Pirellulales bacterium]RLS22256.1 MAG: MFS transporter [Planctomycetota bacterium]RLS33180.1 MAG: MFS transporter [Planctomycetota bacterium]RLS98811.1 MAG: MFS transporter [Planctomycetota bacterium]
MNHGSHDASVPNSQRLLWAGFMAILAAGVGFSIRAGILKQWAEQYGFTMTELGAITGGGLTGAGVIILVGSFMADKVGYGKLMAMAFLTHFLSVVLTLLAGAAFASGGKDAAYQCLYWGMFLFAVGNGICEAVVNPLVASLFPSNKTHYLNILHAGWPGGLIIGGLLSYGMNPDGVKAVDWQIQMSIFMIPVVLYGVMVFGQRFPKSEASEAGVGYGEMFSQLFAPLMIVLLVLHALVGYVELGTDSWISKITGTIMNSPQKGLLLFVYTSGLMFALRFFAGPIVHRISPLGLLCVSGVLGFVGLQMLGNDQLVNTVGFCVAAATVYACGKTFLWPTMLAVVSERFPRGGAITIGAIGGAGMLSAGLLGGPGIGFKQDLNASHKLKTEHQQIYDRYKAPDENVFLGFKVVGLDGAKVGVLDDGAKELIRATEILKKDGKQDKNQEALLAWWTDAEKTAVEDKKFVDEAGLYGGRRALNLTSYVPLTMAAMYLLLILYFKTQGGYKALSIEGGGMKR